MIAGFSRLILISVNILYSVYLHLKGLINKFITFTRVWFVTRLEDFRMELQSVILELIKFNSNSDVKQINSLKIKTKAKST